jgi:excinuclease ABC subunit C
MPVADYKETFKQVVDLLNGKYGDVLKDLETSMKSASAAHKYERAGRLRDGILAIKKMTESQSVISPNLKEAIDVIGFDTKVNRSVVTLMQVRGGKILNQLPYVMESKYETLPHEVLAGFIRDYYVEVENTPNIILVGEILKDKKILEMWLSAKDKHKVEILIPTRGLKRRLLKIANSNATAKFEEVAKKIRLETRFATEGVAELKKKLALKKLNRIEAYDISNTSGADSVGAMVVFENGKMDNQQYRRFKIKSVEGPDDYASLAEVLARRFSKERSDHKFAKRPDLLLIDGGRGQVNVVAKILKGNRIKLIGMAKGDHSAPKAKDEVIVFAPPTASQSGGPGQIEPLNLAKNSPAKYLLQQIRDEAHRFAYAYHTNIKRKQVKESALEQVSGVGPATRKKLIKRFGSMAGVKNASETEIATVVGKKKAKIINNML